MKLVLAKMEHGYDEPITIARKTVQNTDLPKLLLYKVPIEVPCQTLQIAFPTQYTVEIQDPKIRGQSYSTFVVFKDAREADTAYTDIDGKESTEGEDRFQLKLKEVTWVPYLFRVSITQIYERETTSDYCEVSVADRLLS